MSEGMRVWAWKRGGMFYIGKFPPRFDEGAWEELDSWSAAEIMRVPKALVPYVRFTVVNPKPVFAKAGEGIEGKFVEISGTGTMDSWVTHASAKIPYEMWNLAVKITTWYRDEIEIGIWRPVPSARFKGKVFVTMEARNAVTIIIHADGEGGYERGDMDR